jgi:hypothetical protein
MLFLANGLLKKEYNHVVVTLYHGVRLVRRFWIIIVHCVKFFGVCYDFNLATIDDIALFHEKISP